MAVTTANPKTVAPFPTQELETRIRELLAEEGTMQAVLHGSGDSAKPGGTGGGIGPRPVIDSLVAVGVLVELESIVPFELPDSLVRGGGYDSVDEVVQHLMPQLQKRWKKHHEEKS